MFNCHHHVRTLILAACLGFSAPLAAQQPSTSLITDQVVSDIRHWLLVPVVFITVKAQNKRYASLSQDKIDTLDKQWRAERDAANQPLIAAILNNPLSTYLTQIQAASAGLFTEIFVMDKNGLNAGQSSITTDFWQGDEAKFQKTYDVSGDAIFIDEPEYSKETGTWRSQVNMTLQSPDGAKIGAVTVEVNLTELARRAKLQRKGN